MSCIHPSPFFFIHGERPFSLIYLQTAIENSCHFRCVLNWFGDWSTGALYQVGKEFTSKIDLEKSNVSTRYSEEQRYGKKKHLMKSSLKAIVAILESSIVKTDDVTSGRRDMDPHGRLRAVQGRMGQWKILRHSRALTVQKWSQKFDACAELLLLLLFVIKKKALYLKTKVLNKDTILHLLLETRPPFFVVIRASRRKYLYRSVVVEPSEYWPSPGDGTYDLPRWNGRFS